MQRLHRFLWMAVVCIMAIVAVKAAPKPFQLSVVADGATLGTAAANLDVTVADGKAEWKLTDGHFAPASLPEAKVSMDPEVLAGSGKVPLAAEITVKDFTITVEQNTGVDISYRFRLSATLADGAVKSVSLAQLK
ncbi:MAG TPA: hypothetical protein VGM37_13215 [Armatimonadota bacterium]